MRVVRASVRACMIAYVHCICLPMGKNSIVTPVYSYEHSSCARETATATAMDGVVLINVGDMIQRWTSDKLVSTVNRILSE